jgi:hypothetical protein
MEMVIVSNNFICFILPFSQGGEGAVISAAPQMTAGGAITADMASGGPGGPVSSQHGYVVKQGVEIKQATITVLTSVPPPQ